MAVEGKGGLCVSITTPPLPAAFLPTVLNTTAKLTHATAIALPAGDKTRAAAVKVLQDHDFYLQCDPHLTKYEPSSDEAGKTWESYEVPEDVAAKAIAKQVRVYKVTDFVPNPFWDSNVVSAEEVVDMSDGIWVRLRSPLSVVMQTRWLIRNGADGQLELYEEVDISCNRMLISIAKNSGEF